MGTSTPCGYDQWTQWAQEGARSRAVTDHPDLGNEEHPGPLTYEVEVYGALCSIQKRMSILYRTKEGRTYLANT